MSQGKSLSWAEKKIQGFFQSLPDSTNSWESPAMEHWDNTNNLKSMHQDRTEAHRKPWNDYRILQIIHPSPQALMPIRKSLGFQHWPH